LKFYPNQSDGLGFAIQDVWSAKEELPTSTNHLMIDRCQADRTVVTL